MTEVLRIGPMEAHAKTLEGYVYVDVRSEAEFAEGHPAGAWNVPLMQMGPSGMTKNSDFLRVMKALFPRDARLVMGCQSGDRSLRAARALVAEGYEHVVDQRAGWGGVKDAFGRLTEAGWSRLELPRETGGPGGRAYADLVKRA
jgi:rhodanese-related sulfurtransferase